MRWRKYHIGKSWKGFSTPKKHYLTVSSQEILVSVRIPFLFLDAAMCYFSSSGAPDRMLFTVLGEVKVLGRTACRLLMLHRFKKIRLKHQAYPAGTPCSSVFMGSQNSLSSMERPLKHVNTHNLHVRKCETLWTLKIILSYNTVVHKNAANEDQILLIYF